ncbi:hypothetical protein A3D03_00010 [Candidatus Gottesmanbacteria bacterium RIFCSPHIGHO2_02_FULL_40_13]|uniref:Uncharacterized protein n=1 Tax=Candidatus Gottesmanbacteria bacterium RIFCSPHIGHO2_02_FULL_40_13 TaxID=1798384 RepID=A0A1F6A8E2_9BACT|nr:MAG: hypothetical protein A3D03_00010 [Candidatus Gottesmanbacteria bacterium RIFCSPHIGHO2_02_FULL_40_13]
MVELSSYYRPIFPDRDSHDNPQILAWAKPAERGYELVPIVMQKGALYAITYPGDGASYTYGKILKATGTLDFFGEGPVLLDATINYVGGDIKTSGIFFISLFDGVSVGELTA